MSNGTEQLKLAVTTVTEQEGSLLDQVITETRIGRDDEQRELSRRIGTLVEEVLKGTLTVSKNFLGNINARIADIDVLISKQLNAIMHHPDFQKLKGPRRGLQYLVMQSETSPMLKLRVMNVSKNDLRRDLERAVEFDQSALFKKVYEEEYGTFGGAPYGALIGDYEFGRHPQDLSLLEQISHVAAAAHAPFIGAASPEMFNLDSYADIGVPRDLSKIFDTVEYAKVEIISGVGRLAVCRPYLAPHFCVCPRAQTVPVEGFNFKEEVDGTDHSKYLWSNAAYSLGARITDSFAKYGWTVA